MTDKGKESSLDAEKARELINKAGKPGAVFYCDNVRDFNLDKELGKAEGYLAALEGPEVQKLREGLKKIAGMQLDPSLGQIVGSEHYEKAWLDCVEIAKTLLEGKQP